MNLHHKLLLGLVTTLPFAASLRAAESVQDAFRRGLLAEETTRDLKAAAEAYSDAVRLSVDQRAIEATALFRLAECQKKLGNFSEATATLLRLAREYPEQRELLGKAGMPTGGTSRALTGPAMQSLRDQLEATLATITSKAGEIEALGAKKAQLGKLSGVKFAARVPAEFSSQELSRLISELNQVASKRSGMHPDFGPEHPEMKRLDSLTEALNQQMREQQAATIERIDDLISQKVQEMHSLRKRVDQLESRAAEMEKAASQIDPSTGTPYSEQPGASTPTPGASSVNEGGRDPGAAKRGSLGSTPLSEADLRSQIDSLSAELEVLQKLPDAADRGRFLVARHREITTEAFRGEVGSWSAIPKISRTNESWLHFESLVKSLIRPLEDRLQFARMELEALQKQKADREPWHLVIIGHVSRPGLVAVERSQKLTVSQAVQMSGGPTDSADLKKVVVRRETQKGKLENIPVNLDRVLNQGDTSADLILLEGDRVLVPERNLKF